ncbi:MULTISPECIES: hypothetical protein [unclassified Kribbella]|uniref:hypothetical protein n=1 Tax=unclassified Kribbella TaxID=2644121 RepID=UPI00340C3D1C|nr:hypothetical protein OG817_08975 [Kribbella sp. NBC_00889]
MGHYVIRVKGELSRDLTDAFPSMTADSEPAQTVLHGHLDDQAALAGILNHLDMLGINIIEVLQVPSTRPPDDDPASSTAQ